MQTVIMFGFWMHFIGFFCDLSMLIRVKVTHKTFGLVALIAVSVYTLVFVCWLIWLMVVAYRNSSQVCAGYASFKQA